MRDQKRDSEDIDNEILFYFFSPLCSLDWRAEEWECIAPSTAPAARHRDGWRDTSAVRQRQKQQGGAPPPPRRATSTVEKRARQWKNKNLWRINFFFSECILPWDPRSQTLCWPIAAVLDCSNPIEITTRYNSVEKCSKKRCPLNTNRVLHQH